jgi:hypothetical protein
MQRPKTLGYGHPYASATTTTTTTLLVVTPAQWLGLTAGPPDPIGRSLQRHPTYLSSAMPREGKEKKPAASAEPKPLIHRRDSCRLNLDKSVAEYATLARAAMLRDWVDFHDFDGELSVEAMKLVDWPQVLPHERVIVLHHAERRVATALSEFRYLWNDIPRGSDKEVPVNFKMFTDVVNGDADERYVLRNLPKYNEPDLGTDPRVPRTIVVLAKIYHRIVKEKETLALEMGLVSNLLGIIPTETFETFANCTQHL